MEVLPIIGQVIFGLYFLFNALNHFTKTKMMAGYAQTKNVPAPALAVVVSGLFLLFGGLSVLLGVYVLYGIGLLLIFLIVVTLWMHNFWADKDPNMKMSNTVNFMKNFALIGALLMMIALEPNWPWVAFTI